MKKTKRNRPKDPDRDLDQEMNNYEPSDSDDDYDDNEKLLLERAQKGKSLGGDFDDGDDDSDDEEGVLDVYSSSDDSDGGNKPSDKGIEDSDIEGMEDDNLPDVKAWGKKKRNYYHNDYAVDDAVGFSKETEEEQALMEEEEARTLQMKLASQIEDVNLLGTMPKRDKAKSKRDASSDESEDEMFDIDDEKIKQDLSKLTKREKLALLQKQSPEFAGLVADFKERLTFVMDKLIPVLKLIRCDHISPKSPASHFVSLKKSVSLNYCVNLLFYLLLKKKGVDIKDHPVTERILKFRKSLEQLDAIQSQALLDQLNKIIEIHEDVQDPKTCPCTFASKEPAKQKKLLNLLSKGVSDSGLSMKRHVPREDDASKKKVRFDVESNNVNEVDTEETQISRKKVKNNEEKEEMFSDDDEGKRAITYEMAKNKGLTPRRKKDQRNPRVKNRNKYRKALIRRKGQVRTVLKETSKYRGEVFGIKASVIKSKKLK